MWNGHRDSIKTVQHQNDLNKTSDWPVHSGLFQTGSKAREREKQETDWMITIEAADPAQTELPSPIRFVVEEGWHSSLLRQLQTTERSEDSRLISNAVHRRMCRLTTQYNDIADVERQVWHL